CLQRALDLDLAIALENVALLDVVVPDDLHAALHAGPDFLRVVLEAFELLEAAIVLHDHAVAGNADKRVALHRAVRDVAPRAGASLADLEDLPDLGVPQHFLAQLGREHALRGLLEIVGDVVDDVVGADLDALLFGQSPRLARRDDVEPDDDGPRRISE